VICGPLALGGRAICFNLRDLRFLLGRAGPISSIQNLASSIGWAGGRLPLDHGHRSETRDLFGDPGADHRVDHRIHVLVGVRGLLGETR